MGIRSPLSRKTLARITLRVAGVVLLSAGFSYLYAVSALQAQAKQELQKYITERGQRESSRFQLAQSNLALLQQRFLIELKQPVSPNLDIEFNQVFLPWNDRTLRNFPQKRSIQGFDTLRYPTASVGRTEQGGKTPITAELQHRAMTAYKLVGSYGAAWTKQFADLYYVSPENVNINYWRGIPLALTSPSELYQPKEEYFYVADPVHNPSRSNAWTGVYLDPSVNIWMVSAILPVYQGDRFLGILGHDIVLTDLLEKTLNDRQLGTTNMLFRADGRLVAHPDRMKEIQAAQGQLAIERIADPHLQRIFQQVKNAPEVTHVIDNSQDHEFIAVTQLKGPDWYFVTIYPKSLLAGSAWTTAQFVLVSGLSALIIEIFLIAAVLRQQIATPLQQLTEASQQWASGNFEIQLDASRPDELGDLAGAFNSMASQLKTSFDQLENVNAALADRVAELQKTVCMLHQTQAQVVQSEKMSALGNLVAGIAHEINNPLSFLNGSIKHAQDYIQDLLNHLGLYQKHYPIAGAVIQNHAEDIDLEFLIEDLPKLLGSMTGATDRLKGISLSLRNFSRADAEYKVSANLQEGLDSTLLILKYRLQAHDHRPEIKVLRDYGELPPIACFPGQLNQVFMNILANAIDALEESHQTLSLTEVQSHPPQIKIRTRVKDNRVQIIIADNGAGIPEDLKERIFDHLFTTKDVGKGTGLGLAIAQQIIVEKHSGAIGVTSEVSKGTEFIIELPV
ncbi:MAG: HAMP domain-containing protein [Leptolyngbyaceae cyanobacterium CSU_1_4]|nr:HAMP domain-containing protein [Leptolyngbyaceae cyanobacterium CSU_1_4]